MLVVTGKSKALPIPKKQAPETKCNGHLFDPCMASSPPNDFIRKLHARLGERIEVKRTNQ